jgi:hypothetical protein
VYGAEAVDSVYIPDLARAVHGADGNQPVTVQHGPSVPGQVDGLVPQRLGQVLLGHVLAGLVDDFGRGHQIRPCWYVVVPELPPG